MRRHSYQWLRGILERGIIPIRKRKGLLSNTSFLLQHFHLRERKSYLFRHTSFTSYQARYLVAIPTRCCQQITCIDNLRWFTVHVSHVGCSQFVQWPYMRHMQMLNGSVDAGARRVRLVIVKDLWVLRRHVIWTKTRTRGFHPPSPSANV